MRADLPIIARADGTDAVRALYALGIQEVTSPEFEAAIEMTRQALMYFNVPAHDVLQVASAIRRERYGVSGEQLDDQTRDHDADRRNRPAARFHLGRLARRQSVRRPDAGRACESVPRLAPRSSAIVHAGSLAANPDGESRLEAGDLVAVLGTRDQIGRFEETAQPRESAVRDA